MYVYFMNQKELTKAEEQVMQILWKIRKGFVKDILEEVPQPKPAYTTLSTIIRILEKKGFVAYRAYGKTHEYYPLISEETYKKFITEKLVSSYFGNSFKSLVSFFVEEKNLSLKEADEIIRIIEANKGQK
ncbi:putative transcriptional regulator [Anseongella ginsenosidimutans]|uniref:Putative transcriptional regulator n=2 Tax=Anseongella ginsenosidimutans TaxID=496056 RepID=A0A4V2UU26_9SPHI|nr:putative transcriptional regulator [Anseongella ginsenosidimutans]